MQLKQVKIDPFPTKLNIEDPERNLLQEECVENTNIVKLASGDIRAHYKFGTVDIEGVKTILTALHIHMGTSDDRLLIYGINDDGEGFLGSIKEGTSVLEDGDYYITGFTTDFVPVFVEYMNRVFAFGAAKVDMYGHLFQYYFDVDIGWKRGNQYVWGCGAVHQGRMFYGGLQTVYYPTIHQAPGTLRYSEPGSFGWETDNWMEIGLIKEPITALVSVDDGLLIFKESGLWKLQYTSLAGDAKDSVIRQLSLIAGAINQHSVRKYYDTVYSYNNRGTYVIGKTFVSTADDRSLRVGTGVTEISRSVGKLFEELFTESVYETVTLFHKKSEPDVTWEYSDFNVYDHIHIEDTLEGEYDPYQKGVNPDNGTGAWDGYFVTNQITCEPGYRITGLRAYGKRWNHPTNRYIRIRVRQKAQHNFMLLEPAEEEIDGWIYMTWDEEISKYIKFGSECQVKVELGKHAGSSVRATVLKNLVVVADKIGSSHTGAGLHEKRFYVLGKATDESGDIDKSLVFDDGWAKVDDDNYLIYNLITLPILWNENYDVIGVGKNEVTEKGCLITKPIPEIGEGNLTVIGKTGKIDFGAPENPKKLRKIFITYRCSEPVTISVYDDNEDIYTKSLPVSENFINKELNFSTNRSTWYQFEIETSGADFVLRDLSIVLKVFKANE